jgi:hypothetical protein
MAPSPAPGRPPLMLSRGDVAIVLVRVLLAVIGVEAAYVLVANALLASPIIRSAVGSGEGVDLAYASARSWLPGRVHVRDLRLRVEDYNVQFQVAIDSGTMDVDLSDLPFKKFHVLRLAADGVSFRMRHKVHAVGSDGARLAAYPPIHGFADPPLYKGAPSPPVPDSEYNAWSVHIERVAARVRELWVLEYRFEGEAQASGSFLVRPSRWAQVEPASVHFDSGMLHVGTSVVATSVSGQVSCRIPGLDLRASTGSDVFKGISSKADLSLTGGGLGFLDVYLEERTGWRLGGDATWALRARVEQGVLAEGTSVALTAPTAELAGSKLRVRGALRAGLERVDGQDALALTASLADARLSTSARCPSPPLITRLDGTWTLAGTRLFESIAPAGVELEASAEAADLGCLRPLLPGPDTHLAGSAKLELALKRDEHAQGEGHFNLTVGGARFDRGSVHLRSDMHALGRFRMDEDERLGAYAQGAVSVRLSSAESMLSLALAPLFRKVVAGGLQLDELDATVAFHAGPDRLDLELTSGKSGSVSGHGYWHRASGRDPVGAAILTVGGANVGVTQLHGNVDVAPLVSTGWLPEAWRRVQARGLD